MWDFFRPGNVFVLLSIGWNQQKMGGVLLLFFSLFVQNIRAGNENTNKLE